MHRSEEGYSVSVPGLPGCQSQGETEEATENIRDVIYECLAAIDGIVENAGVREVEITV